MTIDMLGLDREFLLYDSFKAADLIRNFCPIAVKPWLHGVESFGRPFGITHGVCVVMTFDFLNYHRYYVELADILSNRQVCVELARICWEKFCVFRG